MKPLSVLLLFLVVAIPLVMMNDAKQDLRTFNQAMYKQYADDFQAAVDDAGAYMSRLEAQYRASGVRYQKEKQLELDEDVLQVFYNNLALKYGLENNPVAIQNLMLHIPAIVLFHYDGYEMVTLDDTADRSGSEELKPVIWPRRSYTYTLGNGNVLYFTLDDQATVFDKSSNVFYQGEYEELAAQTSLSPLSTKELFRETRQSVLASLVERDLASAINRHLELVKQMGLTIQFTLPKGLHEQSIQDIGLMAFIQGYPLPSGERLEAYSLGGNSVQARKQFTGTITSSGKHVAYGQACVPNSGVTVIETFFDAEEAARKGYFIDDCFRLN